MSDTGPHIRHRVQLPDGKHVEIIYRDHTGAADGSAMATPAGSAESVSRESSTASEHAAPAAQAAQHAGEQHAGADALQADGVYVGEPVTEPRELHVCFNCGGQLVYPLDWCEEGERHWRIMLRCPECEASREGVFEQSLVERLDDELDRATGELLSDLRQMTHANMSDEIDFFVRALDADLIVPSDF